MILNISDTDCRAYTFLMKSSISTQTGIISMEMNPLTNIFVLRTACAYCFSYREREREREQKDE